MPGTAIDIPVASSGGLPRTKLDFAPLDLGDSTRLTADRFDILLREPTLRAEPNA